MLILRSHGRGGKCGGHWEWIATWESREPPSAVHRVVPTCTVFLRIFFSDLVVLGTGLVSLRQSLSMRQSVVQITFPTVSQFSLHRHNRSAERMKFGFVDLKKNNVSIALKEKIIIIKTFSSWPCRVCIVTRFANYSDIETPSVLTGLHSMTFSICGSYRLRIKWSQSIL